MYKYALMAVLAPTVMACQSTAPIANVQHAGAATSQCDASKFQNIVGMEANAAAAAINSQPKSVQDMVIYSGSSETPSMLPKGTLVLRHSTPNVVDAMVRGGTVTKVYCNT